MSKSKEIKASTEKSTSEMDQDTIDDFVQHGSDFLLQIWLLMDKMLPEQLAVEHHGGPKVVRSTTGQPVLSKMLYNNYMLFLCVATSLNEKGNLTMSELSRVISVPVSTATRMVDWMVDNRYAERLPDPGDRRIVRVMLTEEGSNLSRDIKKFLFEHIAGFIRHMPEEQRKTLLSDTKEVMKVWTSAVEGLR